MPNGLFIPGMFMRAGNRLFGFALIVLLLGCSLPTHAIDNPDAPDHLGDFLKRAQTYEQNIRQTAHTTQSYLTAYAAYENFLDQELNTAYRQLIGHLPDEAQQALKNSQQAWSNYRDKEFYFIARNWTAEKFGSSATISRGDYRTQLIKDRIMLLLQYFQNY